MSLENKVKGLLKTAVSAAVTTPAFIYLHELAHAAVGKLHGLRPEIYFFEKLDGRFTFGAVDFGICPKKIYWETTAAPYAFTPLGAYLVIEGVKEKNAVKTGIGLPILLQPMANFIGGLAGYANDLTSLAKRHFFTPDLWSFESIDGVEKLTSWYHTLYGHEYAYAHPLILNGRIQDTPFKPIIENLDKIDMAIGVAALYAASFGIAYLASKLKGMKKKKETAANGSKRMEFYEVRFFPRFPREDFPS